MPLGQVTKINKSHAFEKGFERTLFAELGLTKLVEKKSADAALSSTVFFFFCFLFARLQ
jgi:hypothetical protein